MSIFKVPTRAEVSESNQSIFDNLEQKLGFVPNLYATYAKSQNALSDYLSFNGRSSSLNNKEKEIINLVTSQVNNCSYCLAAHTAIAKMNGFNDDQILEIRGVSSSFDPKFDALAKFTEAVVSNRGKVSEDASKALLTAGYTEENLVDAIVQIGDKTISNYIHNVTQVPVDFPAAPELNTVSV